MATCADGRPRRWGVIEIDASPRPDTLLSSRDGTLGGLELARDYFFSSGDQHVALRRNVSVRGTASFR